MVGNRGQGTLLPYREDHVGLTRWPMAVAAGLTIVGLALLATVPTWGQPIGALTVPAFVFVSCGAGIAWVLVYTGWVLGVAIDAEQIRFCAVRKAERRARRGLPPPSRAKPYATWLYEYRCPIPAIRRIWIVQGWRDSEKVTGVPPALLVNGSRVARKGWIGMPFVKAGLAFQFDIAQGMMPTFGWSWKNFTPTAASGWIEESDFWYTPVADPDRCRAALVEALQLNGFELDSEGKVHVIPGAIPHVSVPPPPPIPRKRPRHATLTTALSIFWALIPLLTLGFFAVVPYVYAAARVRQVHTTLIALLVLGLEITYWWLTGYVGSQTGPNPDGGGAVAGMLAVLAIGGTLLAFMLRREVFNIA